MSSKSIYFKWVFFIYDTVLTDSLLSTVWYRLRVAYYVCASACPLSTFRWPCHGLVAPCGPVTYSHDSGDKSLIYKVHFQSKDLSIRLSRGKNREIDCLKIIWYGIQSAMIFFRSFITEICINFKHICCMQCCSSFEQVKFDSIRCIHHYWNIFTYLWIEDCCI